MPAVGNGTEYFKTGATLMNDALRLAQDGITKHEESLKEVALKEEMQATAKLREMASKGELTDQARKESGGYNRMLLNDKIMEDRKSQAMTDNYAAGSLKSRLTMLAAEQKAGKYAKGYGRGGSRYKKKGSGNKGFNWTQFETTVAAQDIDPTSKKNMYKFASDLSAAGLSEDEIWLEIENLKNNNWLSSGALWMDDYEFDLPTSGDPQNPDAPHSKENYLKGLLQKRAARRYNY